MTGNQATRYYDPKRKRLLYITESATPDFWDSHWRKNLHDIYRNPPAHRFTVWLTRKYLPPASSILEGGCGIGDKVYALSKAGFKAKGIDFAPEIVAMTQQHWSHLDIAQGDVRSLELPSASIDGYWSLGVIEHFLDGYDDIAKEMGRVLRPGGYLFLTFPMLNTLRRIRAERGAFASIESQSDEELVRNFYQYALNPSEVIEDFEALGFTLKYRGGLSSIDCLADEVRWLKKLEGLLHRLPFGLRVKLGLVADMIWGKYFGHVAILVFHKS